MADQDHPDAVSSMTALRQSLAELGKAFTQKTSEIHEGIGTVNEFVVRVEKLRQEAARRQNWVMLGLAVLLVLSLLGNVATFQAAADAKATSAKVADCTTAGGRCYEEGKVRGGGYVNAINLAMVYGIECARELGAGSGPEWNAKLEKCVNDKVRALTQPKPSTPPSDMPSPSPGH